jgi:hypothetical protein
MRTTTLLEPAQSTRQRDWTHPNDLRRSVVRTPATRLQPDLILPTRHPHIAQLHAEQSAIPRIGIEKEVLKFDVAVGEGEGREVGELSRGRAENEEEEKGESQWSRKEQRLGGEDARQRRAENRSGGSR